MAYYEGVLDRERPGWREVGDPKDEGGAVHRVVPGIKWWEAAVAVRTRAVTGSGGMAPYCRVVRTGLRRVMLPVWLVSVVSCVGRGGGLAANVER